MISDSNVFTGHVINQRCDTENRHTFGVSINWKMEKREGKLRAMRHFTIMDFFYRFMMTSSNGNIFRVTGPLCGEFTGPGEFPTQRPVTRSFDVFFDLRLNKRLSKQPRGWLFETPSWSLWRQCNVIQTANQNHFLSTMGTALSFLILLCRNRFSWHLIIMWQKIMEPVLIMFRSSPPGTNLLSFAVMCRNHCRHSMRRTVLTTVWGIEISKVL